MNEIEQEASVFFRIKFYLLLGALFLLPFGFFVGPMIGFLSLAWLFEGNWKFKWIRIKQNKMLLLPLMFYSLYLCGLLWTSDFDQALMSLQVKIGILLLPLIFLSMPLNVKRTQEVLLVFISGLIAVGVFMLLRASWIYITENRTAFYYQELTELLVHPSYLSMYFCTGIMILFHGILLQPMKQKTKLVATCIVLFFIILIFLLSSKMGILSMILLFGAYILYAIIRFKRYVVGLLSLLVLVLGFLFVLKLSPEIATRLTRMKEALFVNSSPNPSSNESNQVRLLIWQADLALIQKEPIWGHGTGDVRSQLLNEYELRGMTGALEKKLNAHNQFFQTGIALGVLGMLALLALILIPIVWGIRKQFGFVSLLGMLFLLNMLPESMLETQAGTLFYGLVYSLVLFAADKQCLLPLKAPKLTF
jgi:O-antigen ligase